MSAIDMPATKPNVLVIRHEPCSSLGMLETALTRQQIPFTYLEAPAGEKLNGEIEAFSHLVILGGAVSAYESDIYPSLKHEFELIEKAIAQKIPTLGICLGSQMLAKVLGANVYLGPSGREAGWCEIEMTDAAACDPLFEKFPARFTVFQSHKDTFDLPANTVHLALSDKYPNQSFRYQDHVWAIQFHLEIDHQVLNSCRGILEQELRESKTIDDTTIEDLLAKAQSKALLIAPLADDFMGRFLTCSPTD
jgi:GMP synthase (glutamine-hydrolysing)